MAKIPSFLLFTFPFLSLPQSRQTFPLMMWRQRGQNKSPGSEAHSIRTIVLQFFSLAVLMWWGVLAACPNWVRPKQKRRGQNWNSQFHWKPRWTFIFLYFLFLLSSSPSLFMAKCQVPCDGLSGSVVCVPVWRKKRWLGTAILLGLGSWILGNCCCCCYYSWCKRAREGKKKEEKGKQKEYASLTWMDAAAVAAQVAAKKRKDGKSLCQHSQDDNGEAGKGRMMCARNTRAFLFSFSCAHQKEAAYTKRQADTDYCQRPNLYLIRYRTDS